MPQFVVTTRPERTSDDIAADRKAANAFFARYTRTPAPNSRREQKRERLLEYYSHDWNLLCCTGEASQWSKMYGGDTVTDRARARADRAARTTTDELSPRDDAQLRPYVPASTTKRMQPPGVTPRPVGERLSTRGEADLFWKRCLNPSARFRAAVLRDNYPFSHWLMLHPAYGPEQDAPEGYTGTLRLPKAQRFVLHSVRPAGISYDRALEIAVAALENTKR